MKTTLNLPDALVNEVKLRAVHEGKKLKDAMADLLRQGLAATSTGTPTLVVADKEMLKNRREMTRKIVSGEWGVELTGYEPAAAPPQSKTRRGENSPPASLLVSLYLASCKWPRSWTPISASISPERDRQISSKHSSPPTFWRTRHALPNRLFSRFSVAPPTPRQNFGGLMAEFAETPLGFGPNTNFASAAGFTMTGLEPAAVNAPRAAWSEYWPACVNETR